MSLSRFAADAGTTPAASRSATNAARRRDIVREQVTSISGVVPFEDERLGAAANQRHLVTGDATHFELVEQAAVAHGPLAVLPADERARVVVPDDRGEH